MSVVKVKDLLEILDGYDHESEILIRRGHEKGYYSDHEILIAKLFPEHEPRIMVGDIKEMAQDALAQMSDEASALCVCDETSSRNCPVHQ